MKTSAFVFLGVLLAAAGQARAQAGPPAVPPPATQPPVTTAQPPVVTPAPSAPAVEAVVIDRQRRREQIGMMEGLLEKAVRFGATDTARQVQGMMLMSGNPRARGFDLVGYGVFFHVEVPGVQPSMAALLEMYERTERDRAQPQARATGSGGVVPPPTIDAVYTEAVKTKLIDAMLNLRIDLRADEWLTVAARDADTPVPAGVISETFTIILRMKGSDLGEFFAGRISREDARRRVEVREF